MIVTELPFADDAAVVGNSRESIVRAADQLVKMLSVDNELSQDKVACGCFIMWGGRSAANTHRTRDHRAVSIFRYLGSILESHGEMKVYVEDRVAYASRAFGALCRPCFAMEVYP